MTTSEKLIKIAENVQKNFEFGKAQGGDSWYDTFWDAYQENGERERYDFAFAGNGWTNETFKPKYKDFTPTGSIEGMFQNSKFNGSLYDLGVTFNFNNASTAYKTFAWSCVREIGIIKAEGIGLTNCFTSAYELTCIQQLFVNEGTTFNSAFSGCSKLENVFFEGVIGQDVNFKDCKKLTAESYHSIMSCLSTTASGKSVSLPAYATVKATYDAVYGEGAWDIIAASKTNWTIAYS